MNEIVKTAIHKLLITICMMWIWETRDTSQTSVIWYVYDKDLDFRDPRLPPDKRIVIAFDIVKG